MTAVVPYSLTDLSRSCGNGDSGVVAARQALSYWRARRAIDAEAGQIAPDHLDVRPGCVRR